MAETSETEYPTLRYIREVHCITPKMRDDLDRDLAKRDSAIAAAARREERARIFQLLLARCNQSLIAAVSQEWLRANERGFLAGTLKPEAPHYMTQPKREASDGRK